jgi:hypothetical protein
MDSIRLIFSSVALLLICLSLSRAADLDEMVRSAAAAINRNWAADPKYACLERDETRKGEKVSSKTFEVVMLDGSEYHLPVAADDQPLSAERTKAELTKLRDELERRKKETVPVRRRRINEWKSKRDENGELLLDFPTHFTFQLLREEVKNGHAAYVLSATPKADIVPSTRSEKVLAGMQGTAWIDKETLQPLFVECMLTKSVPVYGALASVLPGTQIEIGMTPVTSSIWLIDAVSMKLNVSKVHLIHSSEVTRSTYTQYRPNEVVVRELLEKAGGAGPL